MITVYTTKTCAYCQMVKKYLTSKGVEFDTVDLDDNPDKRQELIEKTGAMTVPITSNGTDYVVGWNPSAIAALL